METLFDKVFAKPLRARDPISQKWILKGDASPIFFIDSIAVTEEVAAGGIVDVEVVAVNAARYIGPGDEDRCTVGSTYGYEYEVEIRPSWTQSDSETVCIGMDGERNVSEFSFDAPESGGTESVDVRVVMTGSRNSASESYSVSVIGEDDDGGDDAPTRPGTGDPDDGEDGGGGGGDSPLDGLFPELGATEGAAIGLGAVLLFLILLVALQR